jgi:hypothetical protein
MFVPIEHAQMRFHAHCGCELTGDAEAFEEFYSSRAALVGFCVLAGSHQWPCQRGQVLAFLSSVTEVTPDIDRRTARLSSFGLLIEERPFVSESFEEKGPFLRRLQSSVPQSAFELCGRLTVRADGAGLTGCRWRVPADGFGVARQLRVMGQETSIGAASLFQREEHAIVQLGSLHWSDGIEHRLAGELVP